MAFPAGMPIPVKLGFTQACEGKPLPQPAQPAGQLTAHTRWVASEMSPGIYGAKISLQRLCESPGGFAWPLLSRQV